MWVPVGWGYHALESLASAIFLFMLAAGALRTLFSVAQVRFCRYRFCPTGELKYRGAVG
jgi:hypothetical protein